MATHQLTVKNQNMYSEIEVNIYEIIFNINCLTVFLTLPWLKPALYREQIVSLHYGRDNKKLDK